jgi:hypothetical protein
MNEAASIKTCNICHIGWESDIETCLCVAKPDSAKSY